MKIKQPFHCQPLQVDNIAFYFNRTALFRHLEEIGQETHAHVMGVARHPCNDRLAAVLRGPLGGRRKQREKALCCCRTEMFLGNPQLTKMPLKTDLTLCRYENIDTGALRIQRAAGYRIENELHCPSRVTVEDCGEVMGGELILTWISATPTSLSIFIIAIAVSRSPAGTYTGVMGEGPSP